MHPIIQRLKDRKLAQWVLAYAAGAWLVLQVLDVTAEPWGLSGTVIRAAQAALLVGFFVTLVLAWYHGEQGRQRVSGPELLIIAGLLVVSGLLSRILFRSGEAPAEQSMAAASGVAADSGIRPSIAVLPLTNMSADEGDEYFTGGIHEEILTRLAQMEGLRVISRTSVMKYGAQPDNLRQIAEELNVSYIGEGSVRRAADRVLITFQLIDAEVDEHLWAETYERELEPALIFDIQRDVAQRIAESLETRLSPEEQARVANVPTEDLEALRPPSNFDQAIDLDPRYAPAYSGKAMAYANLSNITMPPLVAMPEAKAAARQAIALDPDLAEAHTWLGFAQMIFDWEWVAGEWELRTALELNPNSPETLYSYAGYYTLQEDFDRGLSYLERARELDPESILVQSGFLGFQWFYFLARRYEEGAAEGAVSVERFPGHPFPLVPYAFALVEVGRVDEYPLGVAQAAGRCARKARPHCASNSCVAGSAIRGAGAQNASSSQGHGKWIRLDSHSRVRSVPVGRRLERDSTEPPPRGSVSARLSEAVH